MSTLNKAAIAFGKLSTDEALNDEEILVLKTIDALEILLPLVEQLHNDVKFIRYFGAERKLIESILIMTGRMDL